MTTSHRARNGWVHAQKRGIVSDVLSGILSGTTSTSLSQSDTSSSSATSDSSSTSSATCVVRRKRKNELMREAISFDPVLAERYGAEKEEGDRMSTGFGPVNPRSSNGSGHGYSGPVDGTPPTTMMTSPSYPFGPGYGYGYTDPAAKGLQRPERVMTPPGQARFGIATGGNNYTSQGINWTPDVTPFMPTLAEDTHPTGDDAHRA
ncbi:hypothetical protein H0H93_008361 [Arthromyces matolae]|nr:hypothetical protein H0H93_008361 [Arthromyces matolae]